MQEKKPLEEGYLASRIDENKQRLCITYLRPGQIKARLERVPLVYLPVSPVEWHGLHLPFGTDALNAETTCLEACLQTGGIVWPTLHLGCGSWRGPEEAKKLFGLEEGRYTNSVEFPSNLLPSAYTTPDFLSLVVREYVREAVMLGAKAVVIVSGHAAFYHTHALERAAEDFTASGAARVIFHGAWEIDPLYPECGGHAGADETSLMLCMTKSVDISCLPPLPEPLKYTETGIVDDWSSSGKSGYTVAEPADPRKSASLEFGRGLLERVLKELTGEVKKLLAEIR